MVLEVCLRKPKQKESLPGVDENKATFGRKVFMRGVIEFCNYCHWDCFYCGLRRSNRKLRRYALREEEIIRMVRRIVSLGIKTVVLQSGDSNIYSRKFLVAIIKKIKKIDASLAITLSLGERDFDDYRAFYEAGAERYLLKQEVMDRRLYAKLHPGQSLSHRLRILEFLKKLSYQVGCGFIIGLPQQSEKDIENNLKFMQEFKPAMAAIGPFVPAKNTPLAAQPPPSLKKVLKIISLVRHILPYSYLPATTALNSLASYGYERALAEGCNVLMPNFTPFSQAKLYALYNRKHFLTFAAAKDIINRAGRQLSLERADYPPF